MLNFEQSGSETQIEKEKPYSSRIVLNFFRHGDKEKSPPPGKEQGGDYEVRLTPEGRKGAIELGQQFRTGESMEQAVAKGSPRKRAQETAALVMSGGEDEITGDESFEELKEKLDKGRVYGSKVGTDPGLDFSVGSGKYKDEMMAAFKQGRLMEWLVQESDNLVRDTNEQEGSSYSRMAKNIAKIVAKYFKVSDRFDKLVKDKGYEDTMQRFLGSHQSVTECFLAKAIDKTLGREKMQDFLKVAKQGFGFVEGYQIEIQHDQVTDKKIMHLHYSKKDDKDDVIFEADLDLPEEVLQEIINEGDM